MTLFVPQLNLKRGVVYASNLVNGPLDSVAKIEFLNAAMADAGTEAFIFDRSYDITVARTASINGSTTNIFRIPSNLKRVIGDPDLPLDMSSMAAQITDGQQRRLFVCTGTQNAVAAYLTNDAAFGAETIIVGTVGMALMTLEPGSKVRITSDKEFIGGGDPATEAQGEIATVVSVGADRFVITPPLFDSYAVADNARVLEVFPHVGLHMEGVSAIGPGMLRDGSDSVADAVDGDRFFYSEYADMIRLRSLNVRNFDNMGVSLYSSDDYEVTNCRFQFETENAKDRARNQYGVAIFNASQDGLIADNILVGGKHGVVQSESGTYRGVTRRMNVRGNTVMATWNFGIATHTNVELVTVADNEILGCTHGIEAGCRSFTSKNNKIRFLRFIADSSPGAGDGEGGIGINVSDVAENIVSEGDQVYGGGWGFRCDTSVFSLFSGSVGPTGIRITNFYSQDANQDAVKILWDGSGVRSDIDITGLQTRNVGRPVDVNGLPTSGSPNGANSFDISGNASGRLERVRIAGANLHGWGTAGGTVCGAVSYGDGVHMCDISYSGRAAPTTFGSSTGVVTSNNNAW